MTKRILPTPTEFELVQRCQKIYREWREKAEQENYLALENFTREKDPSLNPILMRQKNCNHVGRARVWSIPFGMCPECGQAGFSRFEAISIAIGLFTKPNLVFTEKTF